ncbi:hypothetical protein ACA910_012215 [Epithemia clementina (nom. ined.)]
MVAKRVSSSTLAMTTVSHPGASVSSAVKKSVSVEPPLEKSKPLHSCAHDNNGENSKKRNFERIMTVAKGHNNKDISSKDSSAVIIRTFGPTRDFRVVRENGSATAAAPTATANHAHNVTRKAPQVATTGVSTVGPATSTKAPDASHAPPQHSKAVAPGCPTAAAAVAAHHHYQQWAWAQYHYHHAHYPPHHHHYPLPQHQKHQQQQHAPPPSKTNQAPSSNPLASQANHPKHLKQDTQTSERTTTASVSESTKSSKTIRLSSYSAPTNPYPLSIADSKPASPIWSLSARDVCCSSGGILNHGHNATFLQLLAANKLVYRTLSRRRKSAMVREIVDCVLQSGGRFLARDTSTDKGCFYDIGLGRSLEETSSAMRRKREGDERDSETPSTVETAIDKTIVNQSSSSFGTKDFVKRMSSAKTCDSLQGDDASSTSSVPSTAASESSKDSPGETSYFQNDGLLGATKMVVPTSLQHFYCPSKPTPSPTTPAPVHSGYPSHRNNHPYPYPHYYYHPWYYHHHYYQDTKGAQVQPSASTGEGVDARNLPIAQIRNKKRAALADSSAAPPLPDGHQNAYCHHYYQQHPSSIISYDATVIANTRALYAKPIATKKEVVGVGAAVGRQSFSSPQKLCKQHPCHHHSPPFKSNIQVQNKPSQEAQRSQTVAEGKIFTSNKDSEYCPAALSKEICKSGAPRDEFLPATQDAADLHYGARPTKIPRLEQTTTGRQQSSLLQCGEEHQSLCDLIPADRTAATARQQPQAGVKAAIKASHELQDVTQSSPVQTPIGETKVQGEKDGDKFATTDGRTKVSLGPRANRCQVHQKSAVQASCNTENHPNNLSTHGEALSKLDTAKRGDKFLSSPAGQSSVTSDALQPSGQRFSTSNTTTIQGSKGKGTANELSVFGQSLLSNGRANNAPSDKNQPPASEKQSSNQNSSTAIQESRQKNKVEMPCESWAASAQNSSSPVMMQRPENLQPGIAKRIVNQDRIEAESSAVHCEYSDSEETRWNAAGESQGCLPSVSTAEMEEEGCAIDCQSSSALAFVNQQGEEPVNGLAALSAAAFMRLCDSKIFHVNRQQHSSQQTILF